MIKISLKLKTIAVKNTTKHTKCEQIKSIPMPAGLAKYCHKGLWRFLVAWRYNDTVKKVDMAWKDTTLFMLVSPSQYYNMPILLASCYNPVHTAVYAAVPSPLPIVCCPIIHTTIMCYSLVPLLLYCPHTMMFSSVGNVSDMSVCVIMILTLLPKISS